MSNKSGILLLPEGVSFQAFQTLGDCLGVGVDLDVHPSEQEELTKHQLAIETSLNNLLLGTETPEEFMDKVEMTGGVVMDEYLADVLDNLEAIGIL